jgi:multidrug efflux pump subunit AcrA (membrane-fusion protein)
MINLQRLKPGKATVIIIGAILVTVLLIMSRTQEMPEARQERAWSIDAIEVKPATLSPTLELFGEVQSPQNSELSAGVESTVAQMLVRDGNSVEKGEILVILDKRDAQLSLQQNEADLREAKAQQNFARIKLQRSKLAFDKERELLTINESRTARADEVYKEGLLSTADLDTANENLARQQLAVNQAELNVEENNAKLIELEARIARIAALRDRALLDLDRTDIKAPFSGLISELQISEGDRVRIGDMLMRLQNPESIEIRAQLPARLSLSIREGMEEGLVIPAMVQIGERDIPAKVLRVSGQTRAGSGGVDSFIGLESAAAGVRLGSTVRVLLELPPENSVIAVPGEAVYGRDRIYKLDGERMVSITVERVGEREYADGRTEVLVRTPELSSGDKVIVTKLANAADGLLVKEQPIALATERKGETTVSKARPANP